MTEHHSPPHLRAIIADVTQFRDAFEEWFNCVELYFADAESGGYHKRDDVTDADFARARRRVAVAAGKAALAVRVAESAVELDYPEKDLISGWQTVERTQRTAANVLDYADTTIGRLGALLQRAELGAAPALGPTELHALVWGAAKKLWGIGEFRRAVMAASDAVEMHGRSQTDRHDIEGVVVWQEAFSSKAPVSGKPRLRWPGDPAHKSVISMNAGLLGFGIGVQQTIRNQATHGQGEREYTPQEALERLAALSLLARWIDECDLVEATEGRTQEAS